MTRITLAFADGAYDFYLGLQQINEIQNKCGAGIGAVYGRVLKGRFEIGGVSTGHPDLGEFYIDDLIETIRQGLIGGGRGEVDGAEVRVTPYRANQLIEAYVVGQPLKDAWATAAATLTACIEGFTLPDADKKKEAGMTVDGSTTRKRSRSAGKKESSPAKPEA